VTSSTKTVPHAVKKRGTNKLQTVDRTSMKWMKRKATTVLNRMYTLNPGEGTLVCRRGYNNIATGGNTCRRMVLVHLALKFTASDLYKLRERNKKIM
jgi:hypothetical protein